MGVDYGVIATQSSQPVSTRVEPAHWQKVERRDAVYYPTNSIPVGQIIGAVIGGAIFAVIGKKKPEFITQFIAIPVGAGTGIAIARAFEKS